MSWFGDAILNWKQRTEWMREARFGVMLHYLPYVAHDWGRQPHISAEKWNAQVEAFDVVGLAEQLENIGAGYCIFTLGQGSGHYCAPNKRYDEIVDRTPSLLSKRDLIVDLSDALRQRGIRLIVYLTSRCAFFDYEAITRFKFIPPWPHRWDAFSRFIEQNPLPDDIQVDDRMSYGQMRWQEVVAEWSESWGDKISGWWIDGVYHADKMYRHTDEPNFSSYARALRAGNPTSALSFAQGPMPWIHQWFTKTCEEEDFSNGETSCMLPVELDKQFKEDQQLHVLAILGENWGEGLPRYDADFVAAYTNQVNAASGSVTWDVPPLKSGLMHEAHLDLLIDARKKIA